MTTPTHDASARYAQDTLILLATALGGAGLVLAGGMLPIPMIGCIGLPLALLAGLTLCIGVLLSGRLEVSAARQIIGVFIATAGLYAFFHAYLDGLGIVVEHFLGREGAPPLTDLFGPALRLGLSALAIGGSAALRRAEGRWVARILVAIVGLTGVLAWGFLIVLAILGVPLGA